MATKTNKPDAWMRLVLQSMSNAELVTEINSGNETGQRLQWLHDELAKRKKGAR